MTNYKPFAVVYSSGSGYTYNPYTGEARMGTLNPSIRSTEKVDWSRPLAFMECSREYQKYIRYLHSDGEGEYRHVVRYRNTAHVAEHKRFYGNVACSHMHDYFMFYDDYGNLRENPFPNKTYGYTVPLHKFRIVNTPSWEGF